MIAAEREGKYEPGVTEQEGIVDFLAQRVVDDGTGLADGDVCVGEPPRARYYLSTLAPDSATVQIDGDRSDRDANNAMGFEMEVESGTRLRVTAECSVYFRILPTYDEQMGGSSRIDSVGHAGLRPKKAGVPRVPLRSVYQRVPIGPIRVAVAAGAEMVSVGREEFDLAFAAAVKQAKNHPRAFKRIENVPVEFLTDERVFEKFLATKTDAEFPVPDWKAHLALIPRRGRDGRLRVNVLLVNDSTQPMVPALRGQQDDARDHFLFRAHLEVEPEFGRIKPIALDLGPDAYRYDGRLAAYAMSCGVEATWQDGSIVRLMSVPAPVQQTYRVEPVDDDTTRQATRYDLLAEDPLPLLDLFAADLDRYANDLDNWSGADLVPAQRAYLQIDHARARSESARFHEGIRWLRKDPRLLTAFRLANRTMVQMGEMSGKRNIAWRSFQLVAIVSELPTLAWREHAPSEFSPGLWGGESDPDPTSAATVVFFPTGGGKTESYLGMTACAMFYDRIRGKGRGITSICRFPLKVLTLNQCQRLVDFVAAGEIVRALKRSEIAAFQGWSDIPFEVGLLIGSDDTPNRLSEGETVKHLQNEAALERTRVVDRCPFCAERSVRVIKPDDRVLRLDHVCGSCNKRLPIIITDGEVYRYLPTMVVGTIDKLAAMGLSDRFGNLLGDVDGECDMHGLCRGLKCVEKNLCVKLGGRITPLEKPLVDPSPTFEIVDELHLLTEELGAFDGHYETALAELQKLLSSRLRPDGRGMRMKIIATTATIKGEDRQIDHLFGLRSVVTPSMGPNIDQTFFWRRNFTQPMRLFIGIQPSHGKTAEMTVVRLLSVLHAAIQDLVRRGTGSDVHFAGMHSDKFLRLVELYRRSLTYTTSLVDLGKLHRSIPTQVDAYLIDRGYSPITFEMLYSGSSREGIGEVRRIVEDLEKDDGLTDAVIATSSVSHGLDIDRLNLMIFNGMPKSIAEYIQASSRVGRRVEGLVFIIYNPVRERDRSHFRYHGKFHEYLDRMVAPVAINRWSRFAGRKTFPGIFMAYVLQQLNREWWVAGKAPKHLHQLEQMQQALNMPSVIGAQAAVIKRELIAFYMADRPEALELKAWIEKTVDEVLARLRMAAPAVGNTIGFGNYRSTADFLDCGYPPMISLRDVDEGISFWPARGRA
ncbi:MAG: helicase C-terminal domain-containing protein [Bacillati bacterium]